MYAYSFNNTHFTGYFTTPEAILKIARELEKKRVWIYELPEKFNLYTPLRGKAVKWTLDY